MPTTLDELTASLRQFVAARDWQQFHDPKNLAMLVASEAGELVAEYRWVPGDTADARSREPEARARIADEIADVAIALLLLSDRIGLDLARAIEDKLVKNAQRYPVETARGRAERPQPRAAAPHPELLAASGEKGPE
jgi:NTP pyrophosphatase (non-canonical NTP hydrolase)